MVLRKRNNNDKPSFNENNLLHNGRYEVKYDTELNKKYLQSLDGSHKQHVI